MRRVSGKANAALAILRPLSLKKEKRTYRQDRILGWTVLRRAINGVDLLRDLAAAHEKTWYTQYCRLS
jgi:hypothetical protein